MLKINRKSGFTLAEVLITIAIIGCLTLLLISGVKSHNMSNWQKSNDYKTGLIKYDKVYNAINLSFTNQALKNAGFFSTNADKETTITTALNELNSTCSGDSCNFTAYEKATENNLKRQLADGTQISVQAFENNDGESVHGELKNLSYIVYVDTNGNKEPNELNKDILPIYIDENGNTLNVSPKSGKTFSSRTQKKYSQKEYVVPCPSGSKISSMKMKKNSKTGLYEVIGQACDCTYKDAPKTFANFITEKEKITVTESEIKKNGFELVYNHELFAYVSKFAKYGCFTNPQRSCTDKGGLKTLETLIKAQSTVYGNYKSSGSASSTNTVYTDVYNVSATYNSESCLPESIAKTCNESGARKKFAIDNSLKTITNISGRKIIANDDYFNYEFEYNLDNCSATQTKKSCSVDGAKKKFKEQYSSTATFEEVSNGKIKAKDSTYKYDGTYDNNCTLTISKKIICSTNIAKDSVAAALRNSPYSLTVNSSDVNYTNDKITAKGTKTVSKTTTTEYYTADYSSTAEGCYTNLSKLTCNNGGTPITTASELSNIRNNLSGKYCLLNDITLSGSWTPIANNDSSGLHIDESRIPSTGAFKGEFDGQSHTIRGLSVSKTNNVGLFGFTYGATIKNLTVSNARVVASSGDHPHGTGILIGSAINTTIQNCSTSGSVSSTYKFTGGLVGQMRGGSISNCSSSATVRGGYSQGGLVGDVFGVSISNSSASGTVGCSKYTGGFAGRAYYTTFRNCSSSGNVGGGEFVHSFIGHDADGNSKSGSSGTGRDVGRRYIGGCS